MFVFFYDFPYYWSNNLQLSYCNILQNSSWSKYQRAIVTSWTLRPLSTHQAFCFSLIFLYSEKYRSVLVNSKSSKITHVQEGSHPVTRRNERRPCEPKSSSKRNCPALTWSLKGSLTHFLEIKVLYCTISYYQINIFLCCFSELKSSRCIHSYNA